MKKSPKKTCLRCGKEIANLKRHLFRKNICDSKYLEITKDEMLSEYDKYFEEFKMKFYSSLLRCKKCGKSYKQRQSLCRHKKICEKNNQTTNQPTPIQNIDFGDTQINIHTQNITNNTDNSITNNNDNRQVNINIQPFGHEIDPTMESFLNYLRQIIETDNLEEALNELLKLIQENPVNRNLYLGHEKNGSIKVYRGGKTWDKCSINSMKKPLANNTMNKFYKMIDKSEQKYRENDEIMKSIKRIKSGCEALIKDEFTELQIGAQLMYVLVNNKYKLLEAMKAHNNLEIKEI